MSRSRHRRAKLPAEVQTLSIENLNHEGRGIARLDGKVAFVEGALPGEKVEAVFVGRRSSYDELRTVEVLESSPERVEPPCQWFAVCGGCAMQHLASHTQREHKQAMFLEQMKHSAGLEPGDFELLPIMAADSDTGYRRKARLGARYVHKKGGVLLGFREKHSSFISDMSDCAVLVPAVSRLITPLRELLGNLQACRAIPQIEVAAGERSEACVADHVALILRHMEPLPAADIEKLQAFAAEHEMDWYLQPGGPGTIHKITPDTSSERLFYNLPDYGLKMAFHPSDFTQVNGSINRAMIARAIELADLQAEHRVLDLFCGLGNFTLPLARHCAEVVGVEGSQAMVERGYENARANAVDNVNFYAADLMGSVADRPWALQSYDRVLLDPPRSGAQEMIPLLGELNPGKIVYISCNPATLARDTALLSEQGYVLKKAGIMDMFPHTAHVESIALFSKR